MSDDQIDLAPEDIPGASFREDELPKVKVKSVYEPRRPIRPALISGFCSMKRLGVFLLPPGWDASPSQGYSQH